MISDEEVPLVISRQILGAYSQLLKDLEPELHKQVATYSLEKLQPRVAFEEQVSTIRENLAKVYEEEESWGEAAKCLREIPLETGNRFASVAVGWGREGGGGKRRRPS